MYNAKQREQYNKDRSITCERLGISENQYNAFRRYGQKLHKIYENNCNGYSDSYEEQADEREEQVINDAIDAKCKNLGLEFYLQTDPRGATIYLSKEPIESNNYNRFGSECIY